MDRLAEEADGLDDDSLVVIEFATGERLVFDTYGGVYPIRRPAAIAIVAHAHTIRRPARRGRARRRRGAARRSRSPGREPELEHDLASHALRGAA